MQMIYLYTDTMESYRINTFICMYLYSLAQSNRAVTPGGIAVGFLACTCMDPETPKCRVLSLKITCVASTQYTQPASLVCGSHFSAHIPLS